MRTNQQKTQNLSIVWPFDPYQRDNQLWQKSALVAKTLSKALGSEVSPVYVSEVKGVEIGEKGEAKRYQGFEDKTKQRMRDRLDKVAGLKSRDPLILKDFGKSVRDEARTVSQFSKDRGAVLILASTRGQNDLQRMFRESFVEDLAAERGIPVVSINPKSRNIDKIGTILFATDFSPESEVAFRRFVPIARAFGARVILYSVMPDLAYIEVQAQSAAYGVPLGESAEKWQILEERELRKAAKKFENIARKSGLKVATVIEKDALLVTKAVMNYLAKVKVDMVALAAISDPSSMHLFGNLTRHLIRKSHVPVWTFRQKNKGQKK